MKTTPLRQSDESSIRERARYYLQAYLRQHATRYEVRLDATALVARETSVTADNTAARELYEKAGYAALEVRLAGPKPSLASSPSPEAPGAES